GVRRPLHLGPQGGRDAGVDRAGGPAGGGEAGAVWGRAVKVLFVYSYLTLGGVEAVLRARLDGLERHGIEAHAWFFHDFGGRSIFAGVEDRVHVGDLAACMAFVRESRFDFLSSIDTEAVFAGYEEPSPGLPPLIV